MEILFKSMERGEPGVVGGGQRKYYATIVRDRATQFNDFIEDLADRSTISTTDIQAVLESFFRHIPKLLSRGSTVKLGQLGDLYLSLGSEGVDTPEEVNSSLIRNAKVIFRPSKRMKKFTRDLEFVKVRNPILDPLGPPGDEASVDDMV